MAGQCRADTRALDRRCGGPNPQKTAECLAYSKARTGAEPAKAVERHWVQIASGRNKDDMPREWTRLKAKAPAVLARRTPYVAAASGTNRLLIGPFDSLSAARDVVNRAEEHKSELQSIMRNSYAVYFLKKKRISKK